MNLQKFKISNKKHQIILIALICSILFITLLIIYRTYAIYQESENFNVMKGSVPNQDYDAMVTLIEVDENGNKKVLDKMPEGLNWTIDVSCNNNADASWNYEEWKLEIDFNKTRTKCKLTLYPYRTPLSDYGINERVVENGEGLYRVNHENVNITSSLRAFQKENLQKTEYRYAGSNPNNFVQFNEELWRIIGLVNTPEGQRLKLMKADYIEPSLSWDSSASDINGGRGINEWSQADIMNLLNNGAYYNRTTGACYNNVNNKTETCDFSGTGLTNSAKEMIDTVTWNTGSVLTSESSNIKVDDFYQKERSKEVGKKCSEENYCNDTIARSVLWVGKVGLIYPSDYGYATSGGAATKREQCLEKNISLWKKGEMQECGTYNWINTHWSITPVIHDTGAGTIFFFSSDGSQTWTYAYFPLHVTPVVYLKQNIRIINGIGTSDNPYILSDS